MEDPLSASRSDDPALPGAENPIDPGDRADGQGHNGGSPTKRSKAHRPSHQKPQHPLCSEYAHDDQGRLVPRRERGWRMGLANMLGKELAAWWRTRRCRTQPCRR